MIFTILDEKLGELSISHDEFSELVIRLLDYGVINRDESNVESTLYDRFVACSDLVSEYLSVLKVTIQHDSQFRFIRVYPPGAIVPGIQSYDELPFSNGFRVKPSQQDIAVILVLRVEYEKALREGDVDEKGSVLLSLEGLTIALNNLLKRSLPESQSDRNAIFKRLRQLRLIKFNSESDLDSEDSWFSIQPAVMSFVSENVLSQLYPDKKTQSIEARDVL
jgi:hypothetical protein